jgi:hypothetical protein
MRGRIGAWLLAAALGTAEAGERVEDEAESARPRLSASFATIFATEYVAQGMVFEKKGVIAQPIGRVNLSLIDGVSIFAGFWTSFHSAHTDAGFLDPPETRANLRSFYELDWYAGASFTHGRVDLTSFYAGYYSPSDAYETANSLDVILTFLDRGILAEKLALDPYVYYFLETNEKSGTGVDEGWYLQLGAKPSHPVSVAGHWILLTAPISTGFGFAEFYANDERYGYVSIGAAPVVPLAPWIPETLGRWSFTPSVTFVNLNEDAQVLNVDANRFFATATIAVDF